MIRSVVRSTVRPVIRGIIGTIDALIARISGLTVVGETLSIILGSGVTATGYQWKRGGVDISGATSSTYTLVEADEGELITCYVSGPDYLTGAVYIPIPSSTGNDLVFGSDSLVFGSDNLIFGEA